MRTLVCYATSTRSLGLLLALSTSLFIGCIDATSSTGEEGRLLYTLYTDYDVPELELKDARIVTGHEQRITVRLTAQGRQEVESPNLIQHDILPADGATIITEPGLEGEPPDLRILVPEPGVYTVESTGPEGLIDRITLTFTAPADFDLGTFVRAPWAEDFDAAAGDPVVVEEGSQVTFQPIPLDQAGQRLAGDMTTTITVDPEWAVVPGQGVIHTYENGVWTVGGEINFYFIEPTLVTFSVIDPVSGATGEQVFDVTPVVPPAL
jgi:hypothetical protein